VNFYGNRLTDNFVNILCKTDTKHRKLAIAEQNGILKICLRHLGRKKWFF